MYCRNCGAQLQEDAAFCQNCGTKVAIQLITVAEQPKENQTPRQTTPSTANIATEAPQVDEQPSVAAQNNTEDLSGFQDADLTAQPLPLKWFHFQIYFWLWAGAASSFYYAVINANVLSRYGFYGFAIILFLIRAGVAMLQIVTRNHLAEFDQDGPKLLMITLWASAIVNFCLYLYLWSLSSFSTVGASMIGNMIDSAIMIICNNIYYKKRAVLFRN